jgi:hypothetical protein
MDNKGDIRYNMIGSCCQFGMMCNSTIGRCYEVTFDIYRVQDPENSCGKVIKIAKCSSCITNADTFNVFYPKDASPEEKMLIISATLMIDYCFFEDNGGENDGLNVSIDI